MGTSKKTPAKKGGKTRKAEPTARVQAAVVGPQADEAMENNGLKENENTVAVTETKAEQAPKPKRDRKPKAKAEGGPKAEMKAEKPTETDSKSEKPKAAPKTKQAPKAEKPDGVQKTGAKRGRKPKAKAEDGPKAVMTEDIKVEEPRQEPQPETETAEARTDVSETKAKPESGEGVEFAVDSQETFKELVEKFAKAAKDNEPEQPKAEEPKAKAEVINGARTAEEPKVEQPEQEPQPEVKVNKIPSPSQKRSFLNRVFTAMGLRHD